MRDQVYGSSLPRIRATDLAAYWAADNADRLQGRVFDTKEDALSGYLPRPGGRRDDFYDDMTREQERNVRLSTVLHDLVVHMESSEEELVDEEDIRGYAEDIVWNYRPVLDINNELGILRERFSMGRADVLDELGDDLARYASLKNGELSERSPVNRVAEYSPGNDLIGARIDLLEPGERNIVELKNSRGAADEFQAATYAFCRRLETGEDHTAEVKYLPEMRAVPVDIDGLEVLETLNSMREDVERLRQAASRNTREKLEELGVEYEAAGSPEETVGSSPLTDSEASELLEEAGEEAMEQVLES